VSEFSYIDIFATKCFEYLLVIGFFLVLVAFWSLLTVPKKEIRKAEAEREDLRRLLDLQRERMEAERAELREQREYMQSTLLAQLRSVEQKALAAWREAHPETTAAAPDLMQLLDWAMHERAVLAEDKKRLDYLTHLVQLKKSLHCTSGADASIVLDAVGIESREGATLREAIDAARSRELA
jgi:hypothetical protein